MPINKIRSATVRCNTIKRAKAFGYERIKEKTKKKRKPTKQSTTIANDKNDENQLLFF